MGGSSLWLTAVLLCAAFVSVQCQEDSDSSGSGMWARMKKIFAQFGDQLKQFFQEIKQEWNARTADIRSWSAEMCETFLTKLTQLMNSGSGLTSDDRREIENMMDKIQERKSELES